MANEPVAALDVGATALELLTVGEVAKNLRVSEPTVWRLIHARVIESVKIGTARRVPPDAVRDYIARLRADAAAESGAA